MAATIQQERDGWQDDRWHENLVNSVRSGRKLAVDWTADCADYADRESRVRSGLHHLIRPPFSPSLLALPLCAGGARRRARDCAHLPRTITKTSHATSLRLMRGLTPPPCRAKPCVRPAHVTRVHSTIVSCIRSQRRSLLPLYNTWEYFNLKAARLIPPLPPISPALRKHRAPAVGGLQHVVDDLAQGLGVEVFLVEEGDGTGFDAQAVELAVGIGADHDHPRVA